MQRNADKAGAFQSSRKRNILYSACGCMDPLGQARCFEIYFPNLKFAPVQGPHICVNSFGLHEERDQRKKKA